MKFQLNEKVGPIKGGQQKLKLHAAQQKPTDQLPNTKRAHILHTVADQTTEQKGEKMHY